MSNRLLDVIESLARRADGMTVTELAAELGVNKSTSSRLLSSLTESGMVALDAASRRYAPTVQLTPVLSPILLQLREVALSPMAHAVRQHPEMSLHLGFNRGMTSVFFLGVKVVENMVVARLETHLSPANATAVGKMLLAMLSPDELRDRLAIPLAAMSEGSITDQKLLIDDLQRAAATGIAVNNRETADRGYSLGAPIFGPSGEPIAAIGAALQYWSGDDAASRDFRHKVRPVLVDVASRISRCMGYADLSQTGVA